MLPCRRPNRKFANQREVGASVRFDPAVRPWNLSSPGTSFAAVAPHGYGYDRLLIPKTVARFRSVSMFRGAAVIPLFLRIGAVQTPEAIIFDGELTTGSR